MKKLLSVLLAGFLALSVVGCSSAEEIPTPPDYSKYTDQFTFYAYSSVIDGYYTPMGTEYYLGETFMTKEKFQEYKDCGFNVIMPQTAAITDEDMKTCMDLAQEVGLKVLLTDNTVIGWASKVNAPLIDEVNGNPEQGTYKSVEQFEEAVAERMSVYADHPAFYGVILCDEVSTEELLSGNYGLTYKTIRKVRPNAYIHANQWSISAGYDHTNPTAGKFPAVSSEFLASVTGISITEKDFDKKVNEYLRKLKGDEEVKVEYKIMKERYRLYLELFFEETGADAIIMDSYPLYEVGPMTYYLTGLQIAAETAKKYDADFRIVTQTMTMSKPTEINNRILSKDDLYWLNDLLLGFGCSNFGYFTYYTHGTTVPEVEWFTDGGSFMTYFGEKTQIWYDMQEIFANNQKFAPTILQFRYNSSATYDVFPSTYDNSHSLAIDDGEFKHVQKVWLDKESAILTELYDAENDRYMYMAMNIVDSQAKNMGHKSYQTMTLKFSDQFNYAYIYERGEFKAVKLNNHTLTMEHRPSEATFVIPY